MSVYKRPHGRYDYDFKLNRVRFCGPTGATSKSAALAIERAEKTRQRQRLATIREQATAPMTVSVAFDRFWAEVGDHYTGTYRATVWKGLAWLLEDLGAMTLIRDLGSNQFTATIARRRGTGVKNATVNRTVTELLRRIWIRAARKWKQEVQTVDWKDLILPEPKERVRELRDHEEDKVFASMRVDYQPALRFKIASGFRLGEVVGLQWAAIDFTARTIAVTGKGDKPATVPLTSELIAIITPLRGQHPTHVFSYVARRTVTERKSGRRLIKGQRYPITYSGLKTTWRRYGGAAAGLEDFRMHDCRHTTATRLLRESGNLKLVQKLLRHEDIATTVKYAHADDDDLRAAMESVTESRKKSRKARRDVA